MVTRRTILGLALGFACCPLAWGAALFPAAVFQADGQTRDVATGDFNGDSIPDVVTVSSSSVLTLLPGAGDGTFLPKITIPTSLPLFRVIAADLNGDGRTDIVGLQTTGRFQAPSEHIVTMLGNGDGTFGSGTSMLLVNAHWAIDMTLGDLDANGIADLVVTTYDYGSGGYGRMQILQGWGDGTFVLRGQIPPLAQHVAIGDFNQDGHADLAGVISSTLTITPGLGGFAFGPWSNLPIGGFDHEHIETADVDNDGDLDLVTSGGFGLPVGRVDVVSGNGAGGFVLSGTYNGPPDARRLSVVDLNGDGAVDLVTVGRGKLATFPGFGTGAFGQSVEYGVGHDYGPLGTPETLATADLNGDGAQDVVVADAFGGVIAFLNLFNVGEGLGQPRFGAAGGTGRLATGDFNEDGQVDLAVTDRFRGQVAIRFGDVDDLFPIEARFATGTSPDAIAVGDFNADHHQDLAITRRLPNSTIVILLGQGDGSFVPGVTLVGGEHLADIVVGDFNGDGIQDLAATNSSNGNLLVYLGLGNGAFGPFTRYDTDVGPVDVAVTELDGDGIQDLVVVAHGTDSTFQDKIALLRGLGDGSFSTTFIPMGGDLSSVKVADFNGDSIPDLAVADAPSSKVLVLIGLGGGLFSSPTPWPAPGAASLAVADFDGDQVPDLAALSLSDRRVSVLRGTGSGTFGPAEPFATAGNFANGPYDLAVADINEDGRPDLALSSDLALATLLLSQVEPGANRPPVADAGGDLLAECSSPAGAAVALDGTLSSDPDSTPGTDDDIVSFEWYEGLGTQGETLLGAGATLTATLAPGAHSVSLVVTDTGGLTATDELVVDVADTTPPSLAVTLDPDVLWPPNHRMVPVSATVVATDACSGIASLSLLSVTSSEADDAPGGADGNTSNDVQGAAIGTPDLEFSLRAERATGGPGRTYTVIYEARDGGQHTTQVPATVFVPHDRQGVTDPITLLVRETPAGTWLEWTPVPGAVSYGVVRGGLELLLSMGQNAALQPASCLASGLTVTDTTGFEDPAPPGPGQAIFYLVEYDDGRASGFGTQSTFWDRTEALGIPCP